MTQSIGRLFVRKRILFYTLIFLYLVGLALGGSVCRYASILIPLVPMGLVAALTIDYALERDYVTVASGIVLLLFLLGFAFFGG